MFFNFVAFIKILSKKLRDYYFFKLTKNKSMSGENTDRKLHNFIKVQMSKSIIYFS